MEAIKIVKFQIHDGCLTLKILWELMHPWLSSAGDPDQCPEAPVGGRLWPPSLPLYRQGKYHTSAQTQNIISHWSHLQLYLPVNK